MPQRTPAAITKETIWAGPGSFNNPEGIIAHPSNDLVYVLDRGLSKVRVIGSDDAVPTWSDLWSVPPGFTSTSLNMYERNYGVFVLEVHAVDESNGIAEVFCLELGAGGDSVASQEAFNLYEYSTLNVSAGYMRALNRY